MAAYEYETHDYDVVVVGAGGAGSARDAGHGRAGAAHRLRDQGFPDTVTYGGGSGWHRRQSLGNMGPDHWQWHMYDTVKGSRLAGRYRCDGISGARGPEGGL